MEEPPPPWIVFPSLGPDSSLTQGAEEAYVDLEWLPFWSALTPDEKAAHLDRWDASPDWREAISMRYDQLGFDIAEDAADSARWAEQHRRPTRRPSRLAKWLRGHG